MTSCVATGITIAVGIAYWGGIAAPQVSAQGMSGPVVPVAVKAEAARVRAAVLGQKISLDLQHVTLKAALAAVASAGHVRLTYSPYLVPTRRLVSLAVDTITVGDALSVLLRDTGVEVFVAANGWLTLERAGSVSADAVRTQQRQGTIAGSVTDSVTRASIPQVSVQVEGTALGTVSGTDGKYKIVGVAPGEYRVTARRVGYVARTRMVTIVDDQPATLNFVLDQPATRLDEVVTTAVGDQRRYEVGTAISTINADSIAPTAPITSLTDLISARAPGVEVLETGGMVGSGEAIRIRGLTSLVLQNDPIVIVDGIRQDHSAGGDVSTNFPIHSTHPTPTRLNDIDFRDVESIDVLKGPSASTEYGTDAANGVIVIKTKHGAAGRPQWTASAEQAASAIPETFPDGYYSWGHTTDAAHTAVNCPLVLGEGISPGYARTAGSCAMDSVTRWSPLNHAATSIFGTGSRGKYDLSVSGGSETLQYFVAGALANETGVVQMPSVFRMLADTAHLGLPSAALHPNSEQQRSVRVSTAIRLGPTADMSATGSYLSTFQQTPDAETLYEAAFLAPALSGPTHYYGYGFSTGSYPAFTPLDELTTLGSQHTDRVTGGLTGSWRPSAWFAGHATAGVDHGTQRNEALNYPLANPIYDFLFRPPSLSLADATTDVYSLDVRATATASLMRNLRAVTSAGVQMVDTRTVGQTAQAIGITQTNLTLNGATGPVVTQQANRQATLGGYGEEQVSLMDRLFLTGALRIDAGSGFGRAYATAAYPKASVSWLALDRGRTTVRVRGAFGESGVQPLNGAATTLYAPGVSYLGGTTVTTVALNWPGNSTLKPERTTEFEGGADVGGWGNRASLELTAYSKMTHDALVDVALGGSQCCYTYEENIGAVRNTGVEGNATIGVLQGRTVSWDVGVTASINHNTLVSLAPGVTAQIVSAYPVNFRQTPGFPLYGIWAQRVTYADANHDHIIEANEVTLADSATYVGPSLPTREASVSTHLGLWRGAVTVGGLVDYRGGYRVVNATADFSDGIGRTRATNDPATPLWLQARAVENATFGFPASDAEDGSFVRIREVSVTYAVPRRLLRGLRVQNLSVTGAVRNLALWTGYTGVDPEATNTGGNNVQSVPTSNGSIANNDVRLDLGSVPLARYWVVRLNIGL